MRHPARSVTIKGPGFRNDLDVRRVWLCPTCGQTQRLTQDFTSARCGCVRDGMPMKLAEEPRSPRIALRADARAVIDRIQAGEVIPRLVSALTPGRSNDGESGGMGNEFDDEGNRRSSRRPERQDSDRPPRDESRLPRDETRADANSSQEATPREEERVAEMEPSRKATRTIEPVAVETSVAELFVAVPDTQRETPPTSAEPVSKPASQSNDDVDDFAAGIHDD